MSLEEGRPLPLVLLERRFIRTGDEGHRRTKPRGGIQVLAVPGADAHRFRHTLATELLGNGASFEEVADILGNSPEIVRKHYEKWSPARQSRIDSLMQRVHNGTDCALDEQMRIQ